MTAVAAAPQVNQRSRGRTSFWAGICICLLGLVLATIQFGLKYLFVPWYSPVLATLGALLLLVAVAIRVSVPRVIGLVLVAAFAGLQWYFLVALIKLPPYEGPARAGEPFPAFTATLADARPFTEADLKDGSWHVLVFFRGRW
jgi:hypothetical protein